MNIPLPPTTQSQCNLSAEGMTGALSESSRIFKNAEKEALVEPLVGIVHKRLTYALFLCLEVQFLKSWPPGEEELDELITGRLGNAPQLKCEIKTGTFKELTVEQIGNIGNLFARVFNESVCTITINSDLGENLRTLTPPWGVLGLGYSLRDCSFNKENYLSHHALGTLADHLVRRGLFDAATTGDEDHWTQGEADQQTKSVDTKAK